ncbi:MAG: MOSC domain-containing protein, partial [Planctomyces sp.]|nr:MOSC domain-containing protein [Planctomyces sp.]
GLAVRLVECGPEHRRPVDPAYDRIGAETGFSDGFPLLLISEASLEDLNSRMERPVEMIRFRPNLVVSGCAPFAEDGWKRLRIGGIATMVSDPSVLANVQSIRSGSARVLSTRVVRRVRHVPVCSSSEVATREKEQQSAAARRLAAERAVDALSTHEARVASLLEHWA